MKVLWITNIMMPAICAAMDEPVPVTGGWMSSSLNRLLKDSSIEIAVATVYSGKEYLRKEIDGVVYYLLPLSGKSMVKYHSFLERYWQSVKADFKPDVVHVHGSEYPHGLAYVKSCGPSGVVVSLQGIISGIARYYAAGIGYLDVKKCLTIRDFLMRDSILQGQQSFVERGKDEIDLIRRVNHIIGRTDWDKSHALAINPDIQYHYCGETLRDAFYKYKWSYDGCEPHSIFVSQAGYQIKGLHMLLKALPLLLRKYPDTKVYVAGGDPTARPFWRITGYGKYLQQLVKKLGVEMHIKFTGSLNEEAMCQRYLKSNVFVCCSAIENSPNSLGEAQLLGMPYVASFVGGVPEIVNYNPDVLYRFEEYEMLADRIIRIFDSNDKIKIPDFDFNRYDGAINTQLLQNIYTKIAYYRL